ncbi:MAG: DUF3842 family protein [Clostridiales bacterium]|nr:DUF3842 family protein [Clostridiales bacterium]
MKRTIAVIDGKGGGLGRAVVESLLKAGVEGQILALGTNAIATANMLKGGAHDGASGENAIRHMCKKADVIVGAIGILTADAMMGEITEVMAKAVADSAAQKVLIPLQRCGITVAGVGELTLKEILSQVPELVKQALAEAE